MNKTSKTRGITTAKYISLGIVAMGALLMGIGAILAISNLLSASNLPYGHEGLISFCGLITIACGGAGLRWGDLRLF